ncbi:hypothetical protein E2562_015239 [Oryza meyeriana var. granulata]|uniref:Uncharacterized protein n=1 Tax=Oryza meyeriana var. granulata TaxID=110450 RepID=A0A6G1DK00_9ORYZ|nr:hypothetical protein E2562_015239 [Oryza meyeriana var. granulata]
MPRREPDTPERAKGRANRALHCPFDLAARASPGASPLAPGEWSGADTGGREPRRLLRDTVPRARASPRYAATENRLVDFPEASGLGGRE